MELLGDAEEAVIEILLIGCMYLSHSILNAP